MLFSATLDGEVAQLTRRYQRDPVRHEAGDAEPEGADVRHFFWRAAPEERLEHTAAAVAATGSAIVFTRTRHGADKVAKQLARLGVDAVAIHGGRSQSQRNRALNGFSTGRSQVLVATDVAARGIHVEGVACVIHFDPPVDAEDLSPPFGPHRPSRSIGCRRIDGFRQPGASGWPYPKGVGTGRAAAPSRRHRAGIGRAPSRRLAPGQDPAGDGG